VAAAFLAMALPFFFADFLPADFNFLLRIAFFVVALRFLGMGIPLVALIALIYGAFKSSECAILSSFASSRHQQKQNSRSGDAQLPVASVEMRKGIENGGVVDRG
jgi:hypothetical protein